ncbi:MAG TPA: photosynthetic reaction center cytochrome c subunit family protein [Vicinamibacterales bacterium]|jgi:hypothetical protein|nr:photosynthetic reaction center cytochrome c subunit family protein [Vicinamibacterales bacterium]
MRLITVGLVLFVCAGVIATARQATGGVSANAKALADLRSRLAGHENEPAETFFTNISILKGKPAERLPGMMQALTGLIGVECTYCHVEGDFASDDKPAKRTARAHFAMIKRLNQDEFGGQNKVSCWSCHRGQPAVPISGGG